MLRSDQVLVTVGTASTMSAVGSTETYQARVVKSPDFIAMAAFDAGLVSFNDPVKGVAGGLTWTSGEQAGQPATLQAIEATHAGIKVFSLPSVDHPEYGRHIELGVKGDPGRLDAAYVQLIEGLHTFDAKLGPELVR